MKKALLFFSLFISSASVFPNTLTKDFDYFIIFGGSFDKDILSLKINNYSIFKNYKVDNRDSIVKGNLSLIQANNKLNLQYNGNQKVTSKIIFNRILEIEITVNGHVNHFKVDLRKGKIILFEFCPDDNATSKEKKLTIDQIQEPFLFI
ncbi:MAG TPA: hypothetical protein VKC90_07880 [Chitinophagaceae bacterium]|nr:hypothetical protein [Chitinophagaceae bacterium]